ncbi:POTRA domain-containing protein [Denitratisoma sp. agr-D3]
MKNNKRFWLSLLMAMLAPLAQADDERFDIARFQVEGNTLLPAAETDALVAPFVGRGKVYGDIQKALEALENRYRSLGYGTVQVYVPEQELTAGVVRINVVEMAIGKVSLRGNRYFDEANLRRSLPQLQAGGAPNLRRISENVQLANENPSKQVDVTLAVSDEEGKVDARVQVEDDNPKKIILTLDNTGDKDKTGQYRLGMAYRDANLLGSDEVLTLGYITSPDAPQGVDLEVVSVGFRKPFYELGDSLDVILGWSSINMSANVIAPGGVLAMNGKGDVAAVRWNHLFARQGEYTSRLVFGFDQKNQLNPCRSAGAPLITAGCVATLERVASVTYSGQWQKPQWSADVSLGLQYNTAWGEQQEYWRYVYAAGNRAGKRNFTSLQGAASLSYAFDWGGMARGAVSGQYSADPLPASDQFSLTGYSAVRGFNERVLTADSGFVANLELYSPDLAPLLGDMAAGSTVRALTFLDVANGYNTLTPNASYVNETGVVAPANGTPNERISLASAGFGLRYALGKSTTARFDWARILHSAALSATTVGYVDAAWRAHFGLSYSF